MFFLCLYMDQYRTEVVNMPLLQLLKTFFTYWQGLLIYLPK